VCLVSFVVTLLDGSAVAKKKGGPLRTRLHSFSMPGGAYAWALNDAGSIFTPGPMVEDSEIFFT
jgi:hypothetical protein